MSDNKEVGGKQWTIGPLEKAQRWGLRALLVPAMGVAGFGVPGLAFGIVANALSGNAYKGPMGFAVMASGPKSLPVYLMEAMGMFLLAPIVPFLLVETKLLDLAETDRKRAKAQELQSVALPTDGRVADLSNVLAKLSLKRKALSGSPSEESARPGSKVC